MKKIRETSSIFGRHRVVYPLKITNSILQTNATSLPPPFQNDILERHRISMESRGKNAFFLIFYYHLRCPNDRKKQLQYNRITMVIYSTDLS